MKTFTQNSIDIKCIVNYNLAVPFDVYNESFHVRAAHFCSLFISREEMID